MVKMPSEVIKLIENQKIIPIATASSNGIPNVEEIYNSKSGKDAGKRIV